MPIDTSKINPKTLFSEGNLLDFLKVVSPLGYTPTELGKLFKRDRSTVSEMVNRLKKKEPIKMVKDGKNHYYYYEEVKGMKLWNELTKEGQDAVIELALKLSEIIENEIVKPLVDCFNELDWFFTAAAGIILEEGEK